jgi:cysteine desulfurase
MISLSGHKIGAPKGIGALLVRRRRWDRIPLTPLVVGGGQERGLRAGTLPVALIMGLLEATRERREGHDAWVTAAVQRREELLRWIKDEGGEVNGHPVFTAPHILNVALQGRDAEALILQWQERWAVATGSACTSASYEPSHVLTAMGWDTKRALSSVRLSF